ncbi:fluoride efflux transporter CrcB [Exiguobacterium sp. SL-9]|uniref:fluoride efflux transporter CrcB n=1 Tax=Exiguobacterium sp. SL-9 TaxID=2510963 RepID=UPI00103BDACF|nr:fluoride efflux transporter CrcB [Exiguobacterium sp. SL-9]TCI20714.1 fluoride efflux transporter CrcB [Exiguobacterium sp. SL-9]
MLYVYVGLAGALGALTRYGLGMAIGSYWIGVFPLGTLVINVIGSFILGWLTHFLFRSGRLSPTAVTALGTGFIGSFTTFSTFSVETIQLLEAGALGSALLYVTLSLGLGLFSSWLGFRLGRRRFNRFLAREEGTR